MKQNPSKMREPSPAVPNRASRNASMDVFKLIASFFVVFIHVPFPDPLGRVLSCIARSAVPGFFAIAGFFSYGADSSRLLKRMGYLVRLTIAGFALMIFADCISIELGFPFMADYQNSTVSYLMGTFPDGNTLSSWLLLDRPPYNDALWYLTASLKCYGLLWCFVRFFGETKPNYQMLYLGGILLFVIYLLSGVLSLAAGNGISLALLRNAVLLGFPMFAMGLFLGQYWQTLWHNFRLTPKKLWMLMALGMGLSLFEQETISISDAHIGSVLTVLASLLLMVRYPCPFKSPVFTAIAKHCASWSVGIYLVHIPAGKLIHGLFTRLPAPMAGCGPWAEPIICLVLSLFLAMLNSAVFAQIKKHQKSTAEKGRCL